MIQTIFHKLAAIIAIPLIALLNAGGFQAAPQIIQQAPTQIVQNLGSTNAIPDTIALFQTSLQAPITATQTTMTLVSATYNAGATTLASSTYGFIIDEGTSVEEIVTADCTATVCTNMTRGLDRLTGNSSVVSLEFPHRRGASVKITDAPSLLLLNRLAQGAASFPNIVSYTSHPTFIGSTNIVDKKYVDDTAFSGAGVINATTAARGIVQIATPLQIASSTGTCSSTAPCVLSADNATSTFNSATAGLKVVVTQNDGTINSGFLSSITLATSTKITTGIPLFGIGKTLFVATTSQVWTVPSGITLADVACVGAGGSGGTGRSSSNQGSGGGGGAGAYFRKVVDLTGVSTVSLTIGAGGIHSTALGTDGSDGGNTSFGSFFIANGGVHGVTAQGQTLQVLTGGAGGAASSTASTTSISLPGATGGYGFVMTPTSNIMVTGGAGGASFLGAGGIGGAVPGGGTSVGQPGVIWGSGGGGGAGNVNTSAADGANGAPGACIIQY